MSLRSLSAALLAGGFLFADTLTLRDGRTVTGDYLGGDSRQVKMAVGSRVESYPVSDITNINFGGETRSYSAPAPAASSRTPAPILRPERDYSERTAPAASRAPGLEIPSGTSIVVRLTDPVDSSTDRVGQTYRASVDEPVVVDGQTVVPRGADVVAKLVDDKQSGKIEGRTVLTLDLQQIQVNGRMVDIATEEVTQSSGSRGSRTGKIVGGGAALGAIIGAIAGGGKGAAIGGLSGAAAGGAVQVMTKGEQVRIPAETRLSFLLQRPVQL